MLELILPKNGPTLQELVSAASKEFNGVPFEKIEVEVWTRKKGRKSMGEIVLRYDPHKQYATTASVEDDNPDRGRHVSSKGTGSRGQHISIDD